MREFLTRGPDVLVIGTRGRDADLLDFLAENADHAKRKKMCVVGKGDAAEVAETFAGVLAPFAEVLPFEDGFADFLMSPEAQRFFDAVSSNAEE
jgi:hypothetical protein